MQRRKQTNHDEIAATLQAARLFVGDSEAESDEEAAVIEETRRELPRADTAKLIAQARKLAQRS